MSFSTDHSPCNLYNSWRCRPRILRDTKEADERSSLNDIGQGVLKIGLSIGWGGEQGGTRATEQATQRDMLALLIMPPGQRIRTRMRPWGESDR